jgi:Type II secretion system (T2SS), protein F/ClpX C4-type zinc finger
MEETKSARPITSQELAVFCRQVGAMMVAGVDILRAIHVAADQSGSERLQRVAAYLCRDLENGRLFAVAVARYPDLFSPFFVSMVRQGEREGVLGQVLTSMADYLDREHGAAPGHVDGSAAGAFNIDEAIEKLKPLIFWQMLTLGAIALGVAGLWWSHMLEWLPVGSFGPNVALWVGLCILLSALIFHRYHPPKVTRCSFCGRAETDRGALVQGHGVAICPACLRSNVEQLKSIQVDEEEPAPAEEATEEEADLATRHRSRRPSRNGRIDPGEDEPEDEPEKKRIEI